ncbi:MAG: DUF4292 domain-containing protein [Cyclobacteriaceae bacterium]
MNKRLIILLLFFSAGFYSCKREITRAARDVSEISVEEIDFDYFTSRSRISYEEGSKSLRGIANMRIKKDSIIWISITPSIGIEVTRVMLTADSVVIINRMEKNFLQVDYKELSNTFGIDLDYAIIEAVLLGNLTIPLQDSDKVQRDNKFLKVSHNDGFLITESYINNQNKKLESLNMRQTDSQNMLNLKYGNFQRLEQFLFAHLCKVKLNYESHFGQTETLLEIEHQKPELSDKPLKFPFNVPSKYERK